jgi:hypothetical protein
MHPFRNNGLKMRHPSTGSDNSSFSDQGTLQENYNRESNEPSHKRTESSEMTIMFENTSLDSVSTKAHRRGSSSTSFQSPLLQAKPTQPETIGGSSTNPISMPKARKPLFVFNPYSSNFNKYSALLSSNLTSALSTNSSKSQSHNKSNSPSESPQGLPHTSPTLNSQPRTFKPNKAISSLKPNPSIPTHNPLFSPLHTLSLSSLPSLSHFSLDNCSDYCADPFLSSTSSFHTHNPHASLHTHSQLTPHVHTKNTETLSPLKSMPSFNSLLNLNFNLPLLAENAQSCEEQIHSSSSYPKTFSVNGMLQNSQVEQNVNGHGFTSMGGFVPLSAEERKKRIEKYKEKKRKRKYDKKIRYECRKNLADKRIRYMGRFVKREDAKNLIRDGEAVTATDMVDLNQLVSSTMGEGVDISLLQRVYLERGKGSTRIFKTTKDYSIKNNNKALKERMKSKFVRSKCDDSGMRPFDKEKEIEQESMKEKEEKMGADLKNYENLSIMKEMTEKLDRMNRESDFNMSAGIGMNDDCSSIQMNDPSFPQLDFTNTNSQVRSQLPIKFEQLSQLKFEL